MNPISVKLVNLKTRIMEKFTNIFITTVIAAIGSLAVNFSFEYLSISRSFEQVFVMGSLLVLVTILFGSSLYFTINKFKDAKA